MSDYMYYPKPVEPGGRIRSSITNKLNRKLFFRMLGLFISLNILICIITAVALAVYSENKIVNTFMMLAELEPPAAGERIELNGLTVRSVEAPSVNGHVRAWPFSMFFNSEAERFMHHNTERAAMGFRAESGRFRHTLGSIDYIVFAQVYTGNDTGTGINSGMYEIEMRIGTFIQYFVFAFFVLIFFQFLTLISRTAEDRKMIRKTLDPIAELARAAQSLNAVNQQLDHEKMMALAGRLDGIDAGRLDTRIQIDDLQEELKNVAVAINGMLDRINESYAAQSRFVSDASHELRTPIAVIQGYANLLDRWGMEDEKALTESVSAIKDEADNMKDLVEQLLFLARGDSNRINLIAERVDLSALVGEVVSETCMIDDKHEFNVKCDDASGGSIAVIADRGLVKQALRILVDNAIKYSDGEITISASADGSKARLSISDNGIGISPEILPNVFDRFVRADESRARATGGAGLGLSIAHWIAARHNGHMEVLSREGIGTRITLVLPVYKEPAEG